MIKNVIIVLVTMLISCRSPKVYRDFFYNDYFPRSDTLIVFPDKFLAHTKGFSPKSGICKYEHELAVKISIAGYEDTDIIPFNALNDRLKISFSDTTIKHMESGAIHFFTFAGSGVGPINLSGRNLSDFNFGFRFYNQYRKRPKTPPALVIYCVKVKKDGVIYSIPPRTYRFR